MSLQFDTNSVKPNERRAYWQEVVCNTFVRLDCTFPDPLFHGQLDAHQIGDLSVVDVCASGQGVIRDRRRIANSDKEFILVSLAHEGRSQVLQEGREAVLDAGDFTVYDTRQPYRLHFEGAFRQTIVQIPRTSLSRRLGNIEYLTALPMSRKNPLDRLAFDFLNGLMLLDGQLDPAQSNRLAEQGLDLLAMALSERGKHEAPQGSKRTALLFRIKNHIQEHLTDTQLCLASVSQQFGISVRYINSLFQEEHTSFGRHLLATRLHHCADCLRDPVLAHARINEIAYRWGFTDMAYFSRVFKTRYGMSARDYRHSQP